jgi:hypothetical protein
MGETQIDESTFDEYLHSLAELYTAESYHLIEFNCNNFTADVIGFLTGRETPTWITGEFIAPIWLCYDFECPLTIRLAC